MERKPLNRVKFTAAACVCGLVVVATTAAAAQLIALPPAPSGVQVTREYGQEFVTVQSVGNTGYPRSTVGWTGENDRMGRGVVDYAYRIARTEITTGQWLEFLNTFGPRPMPENVKPLLALNNLSEFYLGPSWFGGSLAESDPIARTARYELRTDVPDAANLPVFGISWRFAAAYCNWLHNDKSSDWNALLSGAYDTGTWGVLPGVGFVDSITHEAGARFWIPTLDEWGKAAFYDPNKDGPGAGGWWDRHYSSNDAPIPGLPDELGAQTSTGIPALDSSAQARDIPLAAYSAMSPWGLFDTAGGAAEVIGEYANPLNPQHFRMLTLGPPAGSSTLDPEFLPEYLANATRAFAGGTEAFFDGFDSSFRLAAAVPAPAGAWCFGVACVIMFSRKRMST
ncbi:MAG TPA: SUMF1/EgtB/PvdO family nonheme iron enzyme [Phycisphaerales bacterium]|nr:SUMF1/EgtB/PvdO family nonheme iron enzyme [Phycisphaerales bacterium]